MHIKILLLMFYFILRSGLTCTIYDTYEVPDVYFLVKD